MLGYNKMTGYNVARYNADGTEIQKSDSLSSADSTVTKRSLKTAPQLITASDDIEKQQDKSVEETVRMNIWNRVDRQRPSPWKD